MGKAIKFQQSSQFSAKTIYSVRVNDPYTMEVGEAIPTKPNQTRIPTSQQTD